VINTTRTTRTLTLAGAALAFTIAAAMPAVADTSTFGVAGNVAEPDQISYAQCPNGSHLIGGGYSGEQLFAKGGNVYDAIEANGPSVSRSGAWAASAAASRIVAQALCQKDS